MELESTDDGMTKFKNVAFSLLVKDDKDLAALRCDYASMDARERRMAADWECHSQMAMRPRMHATLFRLENATGKEQGYDGYC